MPPAKTRYLGACQHECLVDDIRNARYAGFTTYTTAPTCFDVTWILILTSCVARGDGRERMD
eukprot:3655005-Amphidinium_carterae.1